MTAGGGVQSIARAIGLLRLIARGPRDGVRLVDIARQAGLTKGTAHRLVAALADEGLVAVDPETRRYHIAGGLVALAAGAAGRYNLAAIARPALRRIADRTADTAYLWVRDGTDVVCLDRQEGAFPIRVLTWEPGYRRPLGVGAGSLALLACLPDDRVAALVAETAERRAEFGQFETDAVLSMVAETRVNGFAHAPGLVIDGMSAVGVAVIDHLGQPLAALSVAAITDRLGSERRREVAAILREAARDLAQDLSPAPRAPRFRAVR